MEGRNLIRLRDDGSKVIEATHADLLSLMDALLEIPTYACELAYQTPDLIGMSQECIKRPNHGLLHVDQVLVLELRIMQQRRVLVYLVGGLL
jgi:hypothetical protein